MEDTLRVLHFVSVLLLLQRLNPCFNGRYSQRDQNGSVAFTVKSLNPCFNGRYSQRITHFNSPSSHTCLNPCFNVLMEDTLRDQRIHLLYFLLIYCLNPCFNGRYSQRARLSKEKLKPSSLNPCFNGRYSQS